jgi:hypothetical protein
MSANRSGTALILLLLINVVALAPMLDCGYTTDDLGNSCMPGILATRNTNAFSLAVEYILGWTKRCGRFFPLAFVMMPFFTYVRDLLVYRIIGLLLILLNIYLFRCLIGRLTNSSRLGLTAALLPPLLFQFRLGNDPILSFCLLLPLLCTYLLTSLLLFDYYLEHRRTWQLLLSAAFYVLAMLTYEIAWPFFLLPYFLFRLRYAGSQPTQVRGRAIYPFLALAASFVVLFVILRLAMHLPLLHSNEVAGAVKHYTPRFAPGAYFTNLAKQTAAAVPLIYRFLSLRKTPLGECTLPLGSLAVLAIAYGGAVCNLLGREPAGVAYQPPPAGLKVLGPAGLIALGLALTLLPSLVIALSPVHFQNMEWGVGYLPVYISYYGIMMILIAAVWAMLKLAHALGPWAAPARPIVALALAVLGAGIAEVNFAGNVWVVAVYNHELRFPREVIQDAARRGLFYGVPARSRLLFSYQRFWDDRSFAAFFYRTYAGMHLEFPSLSECGVPDADGKYKCLAPCYLLRYDALSPQSGYAILSELTHFAGERERLLDAFGGRVRIYVRLPPFVEDFSVDGQYRNAHSPGMQMSLHYSRKQLRILLSGRNWCLCELPEGESELDLLSLHVQLGH